MRNDGTTQIVRISQSKLIHAALIGIYIFLWNTNARLAAIETKLEMIQASAFGKKLAQIP